MNFLRCEVHCVGQPLISIRPWLATVAQLLLGSDRRITAEKDPHGLALALDHQILSSHISHIHNSHPNCTFILNILSNQLFAYVFNNKLLGVERSAYLHSIQLIGRASSKAVTCWFAARFAQRQPQLRQGLLMRPAESRTVVCPIPWTNAPKL